MRVWAQGGVVSQPATRHRHHCTVATGATATAAHVGQRHGLVEVCDVQRRQQPARMGANTGKQLLSGCWQKARQRKPQGSPSAHFVYAPEGWRDGGMEGGTGAGAGATQTQE